MNGKIVYSTVSTAPRHWLLTANGIVETEESGKRVAVGDWVDGGLDKLEGVELEETKKSVEGFIQKNLELHDCPLLVNDEGMRSLEGGLAKAAEFLERSLLEMTPLIVRFHDDCDGVASALLLKKALETYATKHAIQMRASFKQADSAVYGRRDAERDADDGRNYPKKPLLVLLDHGANEESSAQLRELRESGFKIIIIDHHPHAAAVNADVFVSPHAAKGDSKHVTGLLCLELAKKIVGFADERIAWWALQSDHSELRRGDDEHEPVAIDYLAITNKDAKIGDYEKAAANPALLEMHYRRAAALLEKSLEEAAKNTRVKQGNGVTFYLTNLDYLEKGGYPSKGKVLNALARPREDEKAVSVGYGDTTALFRVSMKAHEAGFKANEVIATLKEKFPHAVESGGGHERAASLRFKTGYASRILAELTEEKAK
ncbi:hypothetical protein COX86_04380 [Candidatus Micrarchaeota archaeon CG_4_10_14_0_2_um_filter_60_11]|nr:MAG: hypothetical protein AUJ16_01550 [Candidatus Micrarchaeota archaeon CG1_02_60_51]PIN96620.1 MAG: hypothetical protein COU39_00460 [Candidatus Micrarchaeota archaeon CG10_big_fil_rev_8_21_14_0_10_60_32]PIO01645.1 MAG: hypothetical protein COT58_04045 [Candidatus Micrarchaeota archaeon CG09_land_8_20_14_0_10_60_16]PIZ90546.1 MAG: hypothetical protein COX86_04380 [Candidatus Micrarchaeota archaeon CG_4_10_14_0_2_um_filter_60_11]